MKGERRTFVVWAWVALAVLLVDYALLWGVWGGWINYDTEVQWNQVQSGVYTQWHPFVHMFLMMKIPSLAWNDYRVTVLWQVLWFALAFGYWGFVKIVDYVWCVETFVRGTGLDGEDR